MLRWVALVCMLSVAGCAAPANQEPAEQADPLTFSATAQPDPALALPPATDTMHLLLAPHMAATLPAAGAGEPQRTPVRATGVPVTVDGSGGPEPWTMPRPPGFTYLTGSATIWVEVQGLVTNANPLDPCFWRITLAAPRAGGGGGGDGSVVSTDSRFVCAPEPAVVPTGLHALELVFPGQPIPDDAGDMVVLSIVAANGVPAPGASLHVVSGTAEHDSRVTLNGLQLPLDTQTYL